MNSHKIQGALKNLQLQRRPKINVIPHNYGQPLKQQFNCVLREQ